MDMALEQACDDYEFLVELIGDFLTDLKTSRHITENAKKAMALCDYDSLSKDLKSVFDKCSKDGVVTADALAKTSGAEKKIVDQVVKTMDIDGDGKVTFSDLCEWWSRRGAKSELRNFVAKTSSDFSKPAKQHLAQAATKNDTFAVFNCHRFSSLIFHDNVAL